MRWEFSFATRLHLNEDQLGIYVSVTLSAAGQDVQVDGYIDTGAAYCVVPREVGERLGLDVESGEPTTLRTGIGPMPSYLHYATMAIGDLIFDDVPVCVAKYPGLDRCLIGRAGWLQKVRMNLITYDDALYLDLHNQ